MWFTSNTLGIQGIPDNIGIAATTSGAWAVSSSAITYGGPYVQNFGSPQVGTISFSISGDIFAPVTIATGALPDATSLEPYGPVSLAATGGGGQYDWRVSGLPEPFFLTGNLVASTGTSPTVPGTYMVSVTVTDRWSGLSDTKPLALKVLPAQLRYLHRYYNADPEVDDHFYTNDFNEGRCFSNGYFYEGTIGQLVPDGGPGRAELLRYWDTVAGDHIYTTDPNEVAVSQTVTKEESPGFVFVSQEPGTIPLYRWYSAAARDNFYTTDPSELLPGYDNVRRIGYVIPMPPYDAGCGDLHDEKVRHAIAHAFEIGRQRAAINPTGVVEMAKVVEEAMLYSVGRRAGHSTDTVLRDAEYFMMGFDAGFRLSAIEIVGQPVLLTLYTLAKGVADLTGDADALRQLLQQLGQAGTEPGSPPGGNAWNARGILGGLAGRQYGTLPTEPLVPLPDQDGSFSRSIYFSVGADAGTTSPLYIDPAFNTRVTWAIESIDSTRVKSIVVPPGVLSPGRSLAVTVNGQSYPLAEGQTFDFAQAAGASDVITFEIEAQNTASGDLGEYALGVAFTAPSPFVWVRQTTTDVLDVNRAPTADAGPDRVVEATSANGAAVTLDASASFDSNGDVLTYTWTGPFGTVTGSPVSVALAIGAHAIGLTADDGRGGIGVDTVNIDIVAPRDTTPPVLTLPADITTTAANGISTPVTFARSAVDAVDGVVPVTCSPVSGATFPFGVTTVTCTATDRSNNTATGTFTVTVNAPAIINLGAYGGQVFAQLGGSFTYAVQPGSVLPAGLALVMSPDLPTFVPSDVHAGIIGIPTSLGSFTFSLLRDGIPQSYSIRIFRLNIKDNWTLPDATRNRSYSYQLATASPANAPNWTSTSPLPSGLTLSSSGLLSGTPTVAGAFSIPIQVSDGADRVLRIFTLTINPLAITPASLPNALQGAAYGAALTASGGTPPYRFTADSLPDGLTLTPPGSIFGSPTGSGHWWFNLTVTDAAGVSTTQVKSLVIVGVPPQLPQIDPYDHEIHDCSLGAPCVQAVAVDGGRAPYTWSASGLPPGMDVRSGNGVTSWIAPDNLEIWGTPTLPGDYDLQLTVTDADGQSATNTYPFHIRALDFDYLENPTVGTAFTHHFRLWGGQPPYSMTIVHGRLPLGLTFDPVTRTVSGTPLEDRNFSVVFDVQDASGIELRRYNFFTVGTTSTVRILDSAEDDGLLAGQPIVFQLPACCAASYVWSIESGAPPPGLTISPSGLITGTVTPGTAGRFVFVLRVRDANDPSQTAVRQFSLIVTPLDVTSDLPFGNVGVPYSGSVSATGAAGITWMLEPFRYLPPGLTVQPNGVVSGTPTASGRYEFSLRSTDAAGNFATWPFVIDIYLPGATPPTGANRAPVSSAVVLATEEGQPKSGTLLATDPDGDAMTFSIVDQPDKGSIVLDDPATGAFTYTPDDDAVGYDTFTFRATDSTGASSTATASVFIVAGSPRWPGQTVRVNVANDGSEADGPSTLGAGLSADGRFVVFASAATTLAPNIPPGSVDVFVRDRQTGQTSIVSAVGGTPVGGALPSISSDGRYVVFTGLSSALPGGAPNGTNDVYLYDRETGHTERISVSSNGVAGDQPSVFAVPSADGRYVAFYSSAANLVAGDSNGSEDVFLRDRQTGQTTRVSVSSSNAQGNDGSWRPVMSADGRFIAFNSAASNLVPNDTNAAIDIFVRDVWTGQTTRVSVASDGTQSNASSEVSGISADGRFVVFSSRASNLVAGDTNGVSDVFVHDRQTGQTTRVSISSSGPFGNGVEGNGDSTEGTISADGNYVVFRSWASNLVPNDTNGVVDEFVRNLRTGQTTRVNVASNGAQANGASTGDDDGCCITPTISADGRSIVVFSAASNLVPDDTNGTDDVFVVGPVLVFPPVLGVPANGGSRSVDVAFDYPGTPWTASTTAPWIAIAPPASGSGNATVTFTVAPNAGPFRTATIVVALQTVTVTQQAGSATAIAVADAAGTFGGTTTLSATLTNGGLPFPGALVAFSLNGSAVGTAATDSAGVATLSLVSLGGINAGVYPGGVQATYAGDDVHIASSGSATLSIGTVFPTITWPAPAGIVVGTPLSSVQLNATANVPGTFVYTPPLGTILPIGGTEILSAEFMPADTVNYVSVHAQAAIDVNPASGPASATFHAAGDLPGGPFVSVVRDATKVGGVVYAVGASASHPQLLCVGPNNPAGCVPQFNGDTAVLWTFNGGSSALTPLPDLVTPSGTPVNALFASAITRDGAYIASQARSNAADPAQMLPVRVTRNGLVNLNLGAPPFAALNQPAGATAISEDGSVLYATSGVPSLVFRFDLNAPARVFVPLQGSDTANTMPPRGSSFDGSVLVGTSFAFPFTGTNGHAFRYVHGSPVGTVSAIPPLAGGTWNKALAVSPDGRLVLAAGNSTSQPNGEIYLYDSASGTTAALGSPNTPWAPANVAGMTADGSVVAATFADPTDTTPSRRGYGYIHNARGWFHLTTLLGEQGIDIQADGWDSEHVQITGMSPDATLVFGSGLHNGNVEGFVAEFSPGYLSSFDFPAVAPTDTSIVGVWAVPGDPSLVVFTGDGSYFLIDPRHGTQSPAENTAGFERGRYRWDPIAGVLTIATLQDTDGDVDLSSANGSPFLASVSGDSLSVFGGAIVLNRVIASQNSIVGGWLFGDPRLSDNSAVLVLLPDGTLVFANDANTAVDPSSHDGIEAGTYTWTANGTLTANVTIDTNGDSGLSTGVGTVTRTFQLFDGGLHLGQGAGDPHPLTRIVDPQSVVPAITSPLSASGRAGDPFSYTIAATWARSFDAIGLPAGFGINQATGVIAGTPTTAGTFVVAISAINAFGRTSSASLAISIAPAFVVTALTAASASGTFGGTTTVSATLTGDGSPLSFQPVSFALNGTPVGTATTSASGVAVLSGVSLAGIAAGTYAAGVQATYAGDATHAPSSASATLTVAKAVPVVTWPAPAAIVVGAPLSSIQLSAQANVPGAFLYTPPFGTILPVGAGETLSAQFTPVDTVNYATVAAQVTIDVHAASGPFSATFHAAGDLAGGPFVSDVRDATTVTGVLYAVGASASHNQILCSPLNTPAGCVPQLNADTAVLWTFNGGTRTLTPLPDLATPTGTPVNPLFASAITRDGAYIASQARSNVADPAQMHAVRVTRSGLVNLDLAATPFPLNSQPAAAQAISETGAVLYGVDGVPTRARRFDASRSTSVQIPLVSGSDTGSLVAGRGVSFDGSVMVGTSFVFPFTGTNGRAFRYVHAEPVGTVSAIPLLPGGTWSAALEVSPDGRRVLVEGDSTSLPNGEIYVYDAVAGTIAALGSPNTPWAPVKVFTSDSPLLVNYAGMSADGSVVAATFADHTDNGPARRGYAYIHNANGWFHLTTLLGEQGIDVEADGWSSDYMQIDGISPDGTLVFGSGMHDGNVEGFVVEFSPGYLSSFDFPAVAPTDTSIVGVWTIPGDPSLIVFTADGTYFYIDTSHGAQVAGEKTSGFERGRYRWNSTTGAFRVATLQDTNGDIGLSGSNGDVGFTAVVSGDTLSTTSGDVIGIRVVGAQASVVGGWLFGDGRVDNGSAVLVLLGDGRFMLAVDADSGGTPTAHDGVEGGTYTWSADGTLSVVVTVDTNGTAGFSNGPGAATVTLQLSRDELHLVQPGGPIDLTRIVDPRSVVPAITSALAATGRAGVLFTYTVTATHAASFGASGLPGGLSIDSATGVISGTPGTAGTFTVTISATNSFGGSASASLVITVDPRFAATALSVAPASGTFGGTTGMSATLTSAGSAVAGESIAFSLNGTPVGSATTNAAGIATLNSVSLAGINAGTYASGVRAAFAGDDAYAASSGIAALTVLKATPAIAWTTPAAIVHGTPLSAAQLSATASVPGTFSYTPPAGTILPAGAGQTLTVLFTPNDAANYTTAEAQVAITVTAAAPVAQSVVVTTQEATTQNGTLLATDADGVGVTFSIVTPPARGTLVLLDAVTGAFTYTPNAGTVGYDPFTFRAVGPSGASSTATGMAFVVAAAPPWPGQTTRVSVASDGTQANGSTFGSALSADGRYVAFASVASNLVAGDTNGHDDVFVRDRQTGLTTRASVANDGTQGNGESYLPAVSADGRFVTFTSDATNLVAGDTNAASDVFVRDMQTGQTERVSVATDGTQANGVSVRPAISADGRYVAFYSLASNLVAGDTNSHADVFVRDREAGLTTRISVASDGSQGNGDSDFPVVSADGRYVAFESFASNLVAGDTNGSEDVFVYDRQMGQTTRVSVAAGDIQGNAQSFAPALSAEGRYVAFHSLASNLVAGDTNGRSDAFVFDRQTGRTTRVSVAADGSQANGDSNTVSLSADGRYVAFSSLASNLVSVDTNGKADSFVYDRQTGQTTRVSVATDGSQANGDSTNLALSADGRAIELTSSASNLVAGDTNAIPDLFVVGGVFVRPTTVTVPAAAGTRSVNVSFDYPGTPWTATTTTPWITINPPAGGSANGTVTFTVAANAAGTARTGTIVVALQTVTVNQSPASAPVASNSSIATLEDTAVSGTLSAIDPNGDPTTFSIVAQPARGSVVITNAATGAFTYTPALNRFGGDSFTFQALAGGETSNIATVSVTITPVNDPPVASDAVFDAVEDTPFTDLLAAGDPDSLLVEFVVVSPPAHGTVSIPNPLAGFATPFTYVPAPDFNGTDTFRFQALDNGLASNVATVTLHVAPVNDPPVAANVFLMTQPGVAKSGVLLATDIDSTALTFNVATPPAKGTVTIDDPSTGAFTYTPNAGVDGSDTFSFRVTDDAGASSTAIGSIVIIAGSAHWPGQTVRVNVASNGAQTINTTGNFDFSYPAISADGRLVAFSSLADNLVPGDTNNAADVFVRDRLTGQTTRVSVATGGGQANGGSTSLSISADGRYVAFGSAATNLVADAVTRVNLYLHDRQTGVTTLISRAPDGTTGNGDTYAAAFSTDDRYVAFVSTASNLVDLDTNNTYDVFVHDRETGRTRRVSVASDGTQANGGSLSVAISGDGRYVAFSSWATNLVPGGSGGYDVYVHDMETGHTERVSVSSSGVAGDNDSGTTAAISADGRYVAFTSYATNLVPGDTNGTGDVFVRDRQTNRTTRVSVTSAGVEASASRSSATSWWPTLSADGRFVAFLSSAPNLAPGGTADINDVYVHDLQTGRTELVSIADNGTRANGDNQGPVISADGRFVAFSSYARNLVAGDTNNDYDILVAGGVSVAPTALTVDAAGGSRAAAVSFDYPGTAWTATTTAAWITIGPPTGGSSNGSVMLSIAPNPGTVRIGTVYAALHAITVVQDGNADTAAPVVTAPTALSIYANIPAGATPASVPALAAWLLGATAADDVTPSPVRLPPQLNGVDITDTTVFALGTNVVTFRFQDTFGNIGTTTSVATVAGGRPAVSVTVTKIARSLYVLRVTNTGTGNALNLQVALSSLRTLAGAGTVTLLNGLPVAVPQLAPGATYVATVSLNVPSAVTRFTMTESLTMADYTGAALSTTASQAIFP